MTPTTRFVLDFICWFGTAGVLAYWGQIGLGIAVGIVGAIYLGLAWTVLRAWINGEHEDDV